MIRWLSILVMAVSALAAQAQDVRKVVLGFPPGGTLDVLGRAVAQAAAEEPGGGTWVVDNQPGAGSLLAAQNVARALPDGRTLLLAPVVVPAFMPHLYKKLTFDPLADLVPVAELGSFNFALVVGASVPVKSVAEWVAYCKANPGKTSFGSFGAGTPSHFVGVMFNRAAGTDTLHVPYKGGAPAMQALLSGEIQAAYLLTGGMTTEQAKAGKVRVLAVTGSARSRSLPDVPTFGETGQGLKEMEAASLWYGWFAPKGTPAAEVERLNRTLVQAAKAPKVLDVLAREEIVPQAAGAAAFAQKVQRDHRNWGEVIRSTGFTLDQ
jgi:tripartite-type tricarboxylate transporter receptor subunit TctC